MAGSLAATWDMRHGDCLKLLDQLDDNSIDAVITDPPYHLTAPKKGASQDRGFMGKKWDGGNIAHRAETWEKCLRVVKPGGHLLAFGGSRTFHRLGCALEDAGWDLRGCICYIFSSGFPKSLNVSKAVAKRAGGDLAAREAIRFMRRRREELGLTRVELERRIFGRSDGNVRNWEDGISLPKEGLWEEIVAALELNDTPYDQIMSSGNEVVGCEEGNFGYQENGERWTAERTITESRTAAAKRWEGWGTALKPSYEPIYLCRKPLIGTVAANVLQFGTGALNIDATRIAYGTGEVDFDAVQRQQADPREKGWSGNVAAVGTEIKMFKPLGRWPADTVISHHPGCVRVGTETVPGRVINRWTDGAKPFGDGAGHPFESEKMPDEEVALWRCVDDCPIFKLNRQSGIRKSGRVKIEYKRKSRRFDAVYSPDAGGLFEREYPGDSGGASRFFFTSKASRKEREAGVPCSPTGRANTHPTVKPLDLMRWLVRLVTPPNGLVLDPFAGSGTTGCAVVLEGHRFLGMELESEYAELARHRIRYWRGVWFEQQQKRKGAG